MMDANAGGKQSKNSQNHEDTVFSEAKSQPDEEDSLPEDHRKPAPGEARAAAAAAAAGSPPASAKKRQRASADVDDDDDIELDPAKLSSMSRSERKRYREKKRRSDVNKGFDDLMNLLIEIDPDVKAEAEERARRGQWKGNMGAQEENLLSRVDLIGRTVSVLRRLHQENEQRKLIVERLLQEVSSRGNTESWQLGQQHHQISQQQQMGQVSLRASAVFDQEPNTEFTRQKWVKKDSKVSLPLA